MSPSSTVHGGQYDTKYVAFELLLHAAFVADEIWLFMLEPARTSVQLECRNCFAFLLYFMVVTLVPPIHTTHLVLRICLHGTWYMLMHFKLESRRRCLLHFLAKT